MKKREGFCYRKVRERMEERAEWEEERREKTRSEGRTMEEKGEK